MGAAHVFVDDVAAPVIDERDRHHVERVLRLRPGEEVTASDGAGGLVRCVLRAGLTLEPIDRPTHAPRPQPLVSVGFALVKSDRPEWIVQKLTECGVDRILPFVAARSIPTWDEAKARRNLERWRVIAREAAMQSRRVWLPEVDDVAPFDDVVAGAVLADAGGASPSLADPTILVGPEGGWTDEERSRARRVALGVNVLRAETAAVAAGVLLTAMRAGLVTS